MADQLEPYFKIRSSIESGDLLLWQNGMPKSRVIAVYSRGRSYHAGKACWYCPQGADEMQRVLLCLDTVQGIGGRAVPLSRLVAKSPSRIAVYEANPDNRWPEYNRNGAIIYLWRHVVGNRYGWRALLRTALTMLPLSHWLVRPRFQDDLLRDELPFCSGAIAMAERIGGGVDVCPGIEDYHTTPAQLEQSPFYRYKFHLSLE